MSDEAVIAKITAKTREKVETHYKGYLRDKRLYRLTYFVIYIGGLLLTLCTSALQAINPPYEWIRPAIIVMPLVAVLFVTLMQQLSLREMYELRELGRIECQALRFRLSSEPATTVAEAFQLRREIYARLLELSRDQARNYFSSLTGPGDQKPKGP